MAAHTSKCGHGISNSVHDGKGVAPTWHRWHSSGPQWSRHNASFLGLHWKSVKASNHQSSCQPSKSLLCGVGKSNTHFGKVEQWLPDFILSKLSIGRSPKVAYWANGYGDGWDTNWCAQVLWPKTMNLERLNGAHMINRTFYPFLNYQMVDYQWRVYGIGILSGQYRNGMGLNYFMCKVARGQMVQF